MVHYFKDMKPGEHTNLQGLGVCHIQKGKEDTVLPLRQSINNC